MKALHDAGMTLGSIDGIAYTRGPGAQLLSNLPLEELSAALKVWLAV